MARHLELLAIILLVSDFYIYIYPFHFRFVSRHNTSHRANGEATAHSNQAFGAFWSRVTPPELLYILLLSFDEFRLAMNAHLPVVRLLLCYARQGATPMHQKEWRGAAPRTLSQEWRGTTHHHKQRAPARCGGEPHPRRSARGGEGPPTTPSGGPQPGVAAHCNQNPQPGMARNQPPPQTADPSKEWRGTAPRTHSQKWRGTNHNAHQPHPHKH